MTMRSLLFVSICVLILTGCASQQATAPAASTPTAVSEVAPATPLATQVLRAPVATREPTSQPIAQPTVSSTIVPASPTLEPTPVPQPTPASDPVRVVIGAIDLDRSLVSVGLDDQRVPIVPRHDIGWYNLSAKPGQGENVVMWGHVLRFKDSPNLPAPFARLKEVQAGAPITVYTADGISHKYVVQKQMRVTPEQVDYILPQGTERLTLISCIGDKVIVKGSLELTERLVTIAVPAT